MHKIACLALTALALSSCCYRHVRVAQDVTPGNNTCGEKFDWRYGATDIRVQTCKVTQTLMDRWVIRAGSLCQGEKPRIIITEIDNRTDCYISTDMIRDIFEGVAVDDGRFTVLVGDQQDELELDSVGAKIVTHPKYNDQTRIRFGNVTAPQFLAKVRITKSKTAQPRYELEDYRMQITLYDIETQEIVDSAWDVLQKKVFR